MRCLGCIVLGILQVKLTLHTIVVFGNLHDAHDMTVHILFRIGLFRMILSVAVSRFTVHALIGLTDRFFLECLDIFDEFIQQLHRNILVVEQQL